eukprot:RCo029482
MSDVPSENLEASTSTGTCCSPGATPKAPRVSGEDAAARYSGMVHGEGSQEDIEEIIEHSEEPGKPGMTAEGTDGELPIVEDIVSSSAAFSERGMASRFISLSAVPVSAEVAGVGFGLPGAGGASCPRKPKDGAKPSQATASALPVAYPSKAPTKVSSVSPPRPSIEASPAVAHPNPCSDAPKRGSGSGSSSSSSWCSRNSGKPVEPAAVTAPPQMGSEPLAVILPSRGPASGKLSHLKAKMQADIEARLAMQEQRQDSAPDPRCTDPPVVKGRSPSLPGAPAPTAKVSTGSSELAAPQPQRKTCCRDKEKDSEGAMDKGRLSRRASDSAAPGGLSSGLLPQPAFTSSVSLHCGERLSTGQEEEHRIGAVRQSCNPRVCGEGSKPSSAPPARALPDLDPRELARKNAELMLQLQIKEEELNRLRVEQQVNLRKAGQAAVTEFLRHTSLTARASAKPPSPDPTLPSCKPPNGRTVAAVPAPPLSAEIGERRVGKEGRSRWSPYH